MKTEIEVEVKTATQCSYVPFTAVPDSWKGKKVRIVLEESAQPFTLEAEDVPWRAE